jgi:hypothetical protein
MSEKNKGLYLLVAIPAESEDSEDNKVLGASHRVPSTKDDITTGGSIFSKIK